MKKGTDSINYLLEHHNKFLEQDKANTTKYLVDWTMIKSIILARGYPSVGRFFVKYFNDRSFYDKNRCALPDRMGWYRLGRMSDILQVAPEVFINEDYYFKRTGGIAAYRIVMSGYKRGMSPQDIIDVSGFRRNTHWLVNLFKCRVCVKECYIRIKTLYHICSVVGMPLHALFRPFKNVTSSSVFGRIYSLVATLPEEDVAILAGVARLLQNEDNSYVMHEFKKLMQLRDRLKSERVIDSSFEDGDFDETCEDGEEEQE